MQLVQQELDVMLDAAEDGRPAVFQAKRNDFIQSFADFFEIEASVLIDRGRMEAPRPISAADSKSPYSLRHLAQRYFRDVAEVANALKFAFNSEFTSDAGKMNGLRGRAHDLKKILQPVDQLYKISAGITEGPSGYQNAFGHPEPMDPNDRIRQRTQSRATDFPYDMPVTHGRPMGTGMDGAEFQREPDHTPPVPRNLKASDMAQHSVWEQLGSMLSPYEPGEQAADAPRLGYGNHGRMGDGLDPFDLEIDALRQDFKTSFMDTRPQAQSLGRKGLFSLLVQLDPDYSAELFAPDDDDEMGSIYDDWGTHVFAPGAEQDEDI